MAEKFQIDDSLRKLAEEVTLAIERNEDGSFQKDQVEKLMKLEQRFRKSITKFAQSREIYRQFILFVVITNKNILSARPYFREKSKTFSAKITPAIKESNIVDLQTFHINYNLIKFIKDSWKGPFPSKSQKLYEEIVEARKRLIENNMPLAINRAKLFYRKVPKNHLNLMDIIGIAAMGLVSGVDKWVGEYTRVFNGVCIGRMTGNMIDSYSETTLHFYPSDRSILYRANSLRFRLDIQDLTQLADAINKSYEEDLKNGIRVPKKKITPDELSRLLNAASPASTDTPASTDDNSGAHLTMLDFYEDDETESIEEEMIKNDLISKLISASRGLTTIEQKVLKLKGIKI